MANPASYNFTPEEVAQALMKHQGIHEGMWTFGVNFMIGVANLGKSPDDQLRPGIMCQVDGVSLAQTSTPVPGLTFDAEKLNPSKKTKTSRSSET